MAESTMGPQNATRPVSLLASCRLEEMRAGSSWSAEDMRGYRGCDAVELRESFHARLNEALQRSVSTRDYPARVLRSRLLPLRPFNRKPKARPRSIFELQLECALMPACVDKSGDRAVLSNKTAVVA